MLAAACTHALDHHVQHLAEDHARAHRLAAGRLDAFRSHVEMHRVRLSIGYVPRIRLVTHLDVDDAAIERVIEVLGAFGR